MLVFLFFSFSFWLLFPLLRVIGDEHSLLASQKVDYATVAPKRQHTCRNDKGWQSGARSSRPGEISIMDY